MGEATKLEKLYDLTVVRWDGRISCVYLNDYRVAGGKPWGGGQTAAEWKIGFKDLANAIPEVSALAAQATALLEAVRLAIDLVDRDVIRVRPTDREELIEALMTWNAAITKAEG